jgi:hypothetical protein
MRRFGLDQSNATRVAGMLIPLVLKQLVHRTNDPNDKSFDFRTLSEVLQEVAPVLEERIFWEVEMKIMEEFWETFEV